MKYIIYHNDIKYELTIDEIINVVKQYPNDIFYKHINDELIQINNNIVINTLFICHRINTINELNLIDKSFGIELDIRDDHKSNELILSHDPFYGGELFEKYLEKYEHELIILNVKSERIEEKCLELMDKYKIKNYFFIDSTFPMIYLINKKFNNNNFAGRFSEYENITDNSFDFITWIWVDCFTKFPLTNKYYSKFKKTNKKICLVSPELQKHDINMIYDIRNEIIVSNNIPDAICCKKYNIIYWI